MKCLIFNIALNSTGIAHNDRYAVVELANKLNISKLEAWGGETIALAWNIFDRFKAVDLLGLLFLSSLYFFLTARYDAHTSF